MFALNRTIQYYIEITHPKKMLYMIYEEGKCMNNKTTFHIKVIVLIILILSAVFAHADDNWDLIKDSEGIQVLNKNVAGSEIKEFKATAIIDAPIEVIFEVMADVPAESLWMDSCIESKIIKHIDKFVISKDNYYSKDLVYNAIHGTFPVANRDFIVETEMRGYLKKRSININIRAVIDSGIPVREGYVRITELTGSWFFQYIDRNHTSVVYQINQNPGGNLPSSIVNYINKNMPYKTILGLREITKNEKYIKLAKNGVYGNGPLQYLH